MLSLLALAVTLSLPAHAQDADNRARAEGEAPGPQKAWAVDPYWEPVSYLEAEFARTEPGGANQFTAIRLIGGIAGGVRYRQTTDPGWYGYSRARGSLEYGLFSIAGQSLGYEGRVGSFFGIDDDLWRATTGPDFFFNSVPRHAQQLAPASGLAWQFRGQLKMTRDFWAIATITPGWMFQDSVGAIGGGTPRKTIRDDDEIVPTDLWDELDLRVELSYFGEFDITFGWFLRYNAAGRQFGPIIELGFR